VPTYSKSILQYITSVDITELQTNWKPRM